MIEKTVLDYLLARLPVPVSMEFPPNPPDRFVVLRKGDGSRRDWIDSAVMVADSYGKTRYEAALINEQVKACLDDLADLPQIIGAHLKTDYPVLDQDNKRYRCQAVYDITY